MKTRFERLKEAKELIDEMIIEEAKKNHHQSFQDKLRDKMELKDDKKEKRQTQAINGEL